MFMSMPCHLIPPLFQSFMSSPDSFLRSCILKLGQCCIHALQHASFFPLLYPPTDKWEGVLSLRGETLLVGMAAGVALWAVPISAPRWRAAPAAPTGTHREVELYWAWCWVCLWESGLEGGKQCCATAAGREGKEMGDKCPCSPQSHRRRRAGGAPGVEQQFPASQERSTEEQAVLFQPMGTAQSTSPCAAMEEMKAEGGTAYGYPCRGSPGPELQPVERSPQWGRRAGGAATHGAMLEQCLKGGSYGMELCWCSAGRAVACGKPMQGQFRKDCVPWEEATRSSGRVTIEKRQRQSVMEWPQTLFLCSALGEEVGKGGWGEGGLSLNLLLF